MINQREIVKEWFAKRSTREKNYIFLGGLLIIFFFYYILFHKPLVNHKNTISENITALKLQRDALNQQIDNTNSSIKQPVFLQMAAEQKRLTVTLNNMQQQLNNLKPTLLATDELPKIIERILEAQRNNVTLISLQELPVEPWPSKDILDKTSFSNLVSGAFQHGIKIEFQNDYFSTIDFLSRLEKISTHMYWDSMEYKVLKHPRADVVIQFHVLSLQKG